MIQLSDIFRNSQRRGVPRGRHQRHAVPFTDDRLQKYLPGAEYLTTTGFFSPHCFKHFHLWVVLKEYSSSLSHLHNVRCLTEQKKV